MAVTGKHACLFPRRYGHFSNARGIGFQGCRITAVNAYHECHFGRSSVRITGRKIKIFSMFGTIVPLSGITAMLSTSAAMLRVIVFFFFMVSGVNNKRHQFSQKHCLVPRAVPQNIQAKQSRIHNGRYHRFSL